MASPHWQWVIIGRVVALEPGGDLFRDGHGAAPPSASLLHRHPGAHLETGGAASGADPDLVLHPESLRHDRRDRGADPHLVSVAHRLAEARARLDDGDPHDAGPGKDHRPGQPGGLEVRLGRQIEPLEEARIEHDPGRIRLAQTHRHRVLVTYPRGPTLPSTPS